MKSQDGIILISSLIVLIVVSTLTIAFLSLINTNVLIGIRNIEFTKAFYIAEAGAADAAQYAEAVVLEKEFGGGVYQTRQEITDDGVRVIISKGIFKDAQRVLRVRMIVEEGALRITNWLEA